MPSVDSSFQPWEILASENVLDYSPWLRVIRQAVRLPNGVVIKDYVLTPGRDYSMIIALLGDEAALLDGEAALLGDEAAVPGQAQVLMVRQYKHGLAQPVLEFPAGYLDTPEEAPLACAQRELREETGYAARDWTALGAFCLDPNRAPTAAHFFLARGLSRVAEPHLDATENLRCLTVPVSEIAGLVRSGAICTLGSAAAWGLAAPLILK